MIFQSNIASTNKNGTSWGVIITVAFHALILLIALIMVIPEPQSRPLDPVIMVNFGEPDMGGPSSEMAGGTGTEISSESETAEPTPSESSDEIIENPDALTAVNLPKKTDQPIKKTIPAVTPVKAREAEKGTTFTKKGRTHKGHGSGESNGNGDSEGRGPGNIPGEYGSPDGVPDGTLDGDGHTKKEFRPRQLKKAEFNDEETDDPNPKRMFVIVTVNCDGYITKVKPDLKHTTDTKNLAYLSIKLKKDQFFEKRQNCKGPAKWPLEVLITPN